MNKCRKWVSDESIPVSQISKTGIFDTVIKIKYDVANDELEKIDAIKEKIDALTF